MRRTVEYGLWGVVRHYVTPLTSKQQHVSAVCDKLLLLIAAYYYFTYPQINQQK